jgi:hypothetical protein
MAALRRYLDELWQRASANFKAVVEQSRRRKGNDRERRSENERASTK